MGVEGPGFVPLSSIRANPAAQDAAFQTGFNTGNAISDNVVLRPRQQAALAAIADYQKAKAISDTGMVPAEAAARGNLLTAVNAQAADTTTAFQQSNEERTNPGVQGRLLNAQAVATQDDADKADADVIEAHKNIEVAQAAVGAGGDPADLQTAQQQLETAVAKSGKAAAAAKIAKNNLLIYTANAAAAGNVAQTNAAGTGITKDITTSTAPQTVEIAQLQAARNQIAAQDATTAAAQFATRDANVRAQSLAPIIAAKAVEAQGAAAGVAPNPDLATTPTPVSTANENAAVAGQIGTDLMAQAQLQAIAAQIATGQYTGTVSPALEESIRTKAADLGVPSIVPGTLTKRPLADVAADYAKAVNIKEAAEPLKKVTDDASAAASQLENYQRLQQLVGSKVPTGYLYGLSSKAGLDQLAAEFGNANAKTREQMRSLQNNMIPDATRGLGRMTAPDIALFQQALVGPANTPQNNANIVAAEVASNQRDLDKQKFYTGLVGPLKINQVDQLWNQYIQSNPLFDHIASTPTVVSLNKSMLTPDQYAKLITEPATDANKQVAALAAKTDTSTLPAGNSPADFAAAPATVPFLAARNARGASVPVVNPKYWSPVIDAANALRATITPGRPTVRVNPVDLLNTDPSSFLRPAGAPGAATPVSLDALAPRG